MGKGTDINSGRREAKELFLSLFLLFSIFLLLPPGLSFCGIGKNPVLFQSIFLLVLGGVFFFREWIGIAPGDLKRVFCLPEKGKRGKFFLVSFLAGAGFQLLALVLNFISLKVLTFFRIPAGEQTLITYLKKASFTGFFLFLIPVLILAPLAEEWVFRHVFYRQGCQRFSPKTSAILQALLFAVVHWHPSGFCSLFLFGLFLIWNVRRTGTLLGGILPHFFFNLLAMTGLFFWKLLSRI